MNIYSINLNIGDTVTATLSWTGTADLDVFMHSQGQDLLGNVYVQNAATTSNP
jgi:hypothetical protein